MTVCPSHEQLDKFSRGEKVAIDRAAVVEHVRSCDRCREYIESSISGQTVTIEAEQVPDFCELTPSMIPPELRNHHRYRVLKLLSIGGMGAVYKGEHLFLERPVVIKVIR